MGIFTSGISTIVDNIFTNAKGYNASTRTDMKAFQEASIVILVDPEAPYEELDQSVQDALNATQWGDAVGNTKIDIEDCCEQVINLAKNYYTDSSGVAGLKKAVLNITQSGVAAPVLNQTLFNGIGAIVSLVRDSPGVYAIDFPAGSFPDPSKVNVSCPENAADGDVAWDFAYEVVNDHSIRFFSSKHVTGAGLNPVDVSLAFADALMGQTYAPIMTIEVYP